MSSIKLSDFCNEIENIALSFLDEKTDENYSEMMKAIFHKAELESEKSISDIEKSFINCKKGCSYCCRVHVPVLEPEAFAIAEYLKSKLTTEKLEALKEKIKQIHIQIKYLDEQERIAVNIECAFLDSEGGCSIREVRPLKCRSITSADANACKTAMTMFALDESPFVPMNIKHRSIMDTAFYGLSSAMEKTSMKSASSELSGSVLRFL
jgi:Fe-S-cluster containining protein